MSSLFEIAQQMCSFFKFSFVIVVISILFCYIHNCLLQLVKKHACLFAVHLNMVKLERKLQIFLKPMSVVLSPEEHRVVETTTILIHNAIKIKRREC